MEAKSIEDDRANGGFTEDQRPGYMGTLLCKRGSPVMFQTLPTVDEKTVCFLKYGLYP